MEKFVETDDELLTEILAGRPAIYFVAAFDPSKLPSSRPGAVSLAGACYEEANDVSAAVRKNLDPDAVPTPNMDKRAEAIRLYQKGRAILHQRRVENANMGRVEIYYLALPRRAASR
jgi:hypothetical protein